jgi:hypothetical protein
MVIDESVSCGVIGCRSVATIILEWLLINLSVVESSDVALWRRTLLQPNEHFSMSSVMQKQQLTKMISLEMYTNTPRIS